MKARLVVFPVKGRNWCFSRSIDRSIPKSGSTQTPSTFKDLWKKVSSNEKPLNANAELLVDFISDKMNRAWTALEKAPDGTLKNKIHGLGLHLLARVKPSEVFLKSISKEVSQVEITYPTSLNARLVRRRLRHTATRGSIIHKKYFYGSVTLLPLTAAFTILPLPNIPFFWVLFRTYSHWRALQGSERLLHLVSDSSETRKSIVNVKGSETAHDSLVSAWELQPSEELEKLIKGGDCLSQAAISDICNTFHLNTNDVIKCYQHSV